MKGVYFMRKGNPAYTEDARVITCHRCYRKMVLCMPYEKGVRQGCTKDRLAVKTALERGWVIAEKGLQCPCCKPDHDTEDVFQELTLIHSCGLSEVAFLEF